MLRASIWIYQSTDNGEVVVDQHYVTTLVDAHALWLREQSHALAGCIDISFDDVAAPMGLPLYCDDIATLYVTARAAAILESSCSLVGVRNMGLYSIGVTHAVAHWDNATSDEAQHTTNGVQGKNWLRDYVALYPTDRILFEQAGIVDEATYEQYERTLPLGIRMRSGKMRFESKDHPSASYDHIRRIAPQWLLEQKIDMGHLSVRVQNALDRLQYSDWERLLAMSELELSRIRNLGRKSLENLKSTVRKLAVGELLQDERCMENGDQDEQSYQNPMVQVQFGMVAPEHATFREAFSYLLDAVLNERSQEIVRAWIGFETEERSLELIGVSQGLTRERVRQLLASAGGAIRRHQLSRSLIQQRIESVINEAQDAVPLSSFAKHDPWFDSTFTHQLLKFVKKYMWKEMFQLVGHGNQVVLLPCTNDDIEVLTYRAEDTIVQCADQKIPYDALEQTVASALPDVPRSVVRYIIGQLGDRIQVAAAPGDVPRVVCYGRSLDDLILAILEDSPTPLTVSEIGRELRDRGHDYQNSYIYSRARMVAITIEPGVYGLRRHLALTDQQIEELCEYVAGVLATDIHRQWHVNEVKEALRNVFPIEKLGVSDATVMDLLEDADGIVTLGYHALRYRQDGVDEDTPRRIKIIETIERILEDHGAPMSTSDLRAVLKQRRGIPRGQQIFHARRVIMMRRGLVGLLGRDVVLLDEDIQRISEALEMASDQYGIEMTSPEAASIARGVCGAALDLLEDAAVTRLCSRLQNDAYCRATV